MCALQMDSGTYLEQEAASPAYLVVRLLVQLLGVALHTLCTHEKHTNEEPGEVCKYQLEF
jgi:hypothetical protein